MISPRRHRGTEKCAILYPLTFVPEKKCDYPYDGAKDSVGLAQEKHGAPARPIPSVFLRLHKLVTSQEFVTII